MILNGCIPNCRIEAVGGDTDGGVSRGLCLHKPLIGCDNLGCTLLNGINTDFDELEDDLFIKNKLKVFIARLDKIHPIISGNKLFKLHYFIEAALKSSHKTIITYGGAFSNHLLASAYACKLYGIKCIGIVRGERPENLSHTLIQCQEYGMELFFIPRDIYRNISQTEIPEFLLPTVREAVVVAEGGYCPQGAIGASLIMDKIEKINATHICAAVGTATTISGLLMEAKPNQQIIGIPVIKNMKDINERVFLLTGHRYEPTIFEDYSFGGYAKKTEELISFMNAFYTKHKIPTDFVYTAKMMYGVMDKIKKGFFPPLSRIVCLHTGGLQGNQSLAKDVLHF